jgi:hypothetical protein
MTLTFAGDEIRPRNLDLVDVIQRSAKGQSRISGGVKRRQLGWRSARTEASVTSSASVSWRRHAYASRSR